MEQNSYDLVLTDLKMPEIDGISLIKWIRKSQPSTGIVIITAYPSQETMKETLDLGIIDYVLKPYTPEMLREVTRSAINKQALEKEAEEEFNPEMLTELDKVISHYTRRPGSTIPVMQRAQEIVGYLPPAIQERIASGLDVSSAEIQSIISFYSFFTMVPRGKHTVRVCLGTACYVKGIDTVLNKIKEVLNIAVGETTEDKEFTLEAVRCVGACGLAPVMVVDEDTHGGLTQRKAIDSLNNYSPVGVPAAPGEGGIAAGREA
jgi:NADH-quinone oxidoreductase subunit E/NADP-reducing hydrogenase subunit HndA